MSRKEEYILAIYNHKNAFKNVFVSHCQDCTHVHFVKDGDEELYPEFKTECSKCKSKNIKTSKG